MTVTNVFEVSSFAPPPPQLPAKKNHPHAAVAVGGRENMQNDSGDEEIRKKAKIFMKSRSPNSCVVIQEQKNCMAII